MIYKVKASGCDVLLRGPLLPGADSEGPEDHVVRAFARVSQ